MTGFAVQPAALRAFAGVLSENGGNLSAQYLLDYENYNDTWVKVSGSGLIFAAIHDKIEALRTRLDTDAYTINTSLIESGFGLTTSADGYAKTDRATAEQIDAKYHPGGVPSLDVSVDEATPAEVPSTLLVEPSDENVVPDLAQELIDGAGVMSESDLVIKILRWCGIDIMGWIGDRLLGDHKQLARCRSALEHIGEFDDAAAEVVARGSTTMLKSWTGNAAAGAETYFNTFANALSDHATQVKGVASRISALMVGMQEGLAALEGAITTALDAAIEAAAAVAAASCVQWIPGVDVLADIIGGYKVYKVVKAVKEVTDIWNKVWAGHEGIMGLITGLIGGFAGYDVKAALPTVGYYNASQGPEPDYSEPDLPGKGATVTDSDAAEGDGGIRPADTTNGIAHLVRYDERDARELRANLAVFARRSTDPAVVNLVSEVLAGRRNVREVFRTKEFQAVGAAHLDNIERGVAAMPAETRMDLFDRLYAGTLPITDQRTLDTMRDTGLPESAVAPGRPAENDTDEDEGWSRQ